MGLRGRVRRLESKAHVTVLYDPATGEELVVPENADLAVLTAAWAEGAGVECRRRDPVVEDLRERLKRGALIEKRTGKQWPHFP